LAWRSLHAKFHPYRCNDKGVGPQKLKFLLRFDQNVEYKRPAGAYPLRDFYQIYRVCTTFHDALALKIWLDLLELLWSNGGFKLRGLVSPKFSVPPSCETMRQTPKVLEMQERARGPLSSCQVWLGSDFTPAGVAKYVEFFVCLSACLFVCLFITLLNVRDCAPDFAMKALEYINDFDAVG